MAPLGDIPAWSWVVGAGGPCGELAWGALEGLPGEQHCGTCPAGMLTVSPCAGDTTQPGVCTNGGHISTQVHILGGCWAARTQSQGGRACHQAGAPVPALHLPHVGLQGRWLLLHLWLWPRRIVAMFHLRGPRMGTKLAGSGTTWLNLSLPLGSQIPAPGSPSAACVCQGGLCQPAPRLLRYFWGGLPCAGVCYNGGGGGNV